MIPLAAQQPAVARQLAVEVAQAAAKLFLVLRILERYFAQALSGTQEVDVAVVESGHDPTPFQIHDLRAGSDERLDVIVLADGDDAAMPDGDCLGFRLVLVDRPDLAIPQDEVGVCFLDGGRWSR